MKSTNSTPPSGGEMRPTPAAMHASDEAVWLDDHAVLEEGPAEEQTADPPLLNEAQVLAHAERPLWRPLTVQDAERTYQWLRRLLEEEPQYKKREYHRALTASMRLLFLARTAEARMTVWMLIARFTDVVTGFNDVRREGSPWFEHENQWMYAQNNHTRRQIKRACDATRKALCIMACAKPLDMEATLRLRKHLVCYLRALDLLVLLHQELRQLQKIEAARKEIRF